MPDMKNRNQPYWMLMGTLRKLEEIDAPNLYLLNCTFGSTIIEQLPPGIQKWWAENKHFHNDDNPKYSHFPEQIVVTSPTPMFYQFDYDVLL